MTGSGQTYGTENDSKRRDVSHRMGNKEELMQQAANFGEWEYGPIKVRYMLYQDRLVTNTLYKKTHRKKSVSHLTGRRDDLEDGQGV